MPQNRPTKAMYQIASRPVMVRLPRGPLAAFRRAALRRFPIELLAYLIGTNQGSRIEVEEIWLSEGPADEDNVSSTLEEVTRFDRQARAAGLQILGTLHSHPFDGWLGTHMALNAAPSVADIRNAAECREWVYGIYGIWQRASGRRQTRLEMFLGTPELRVEVA